MSREETLAIMAVLKAAYPNYYRDMKVGDAESIVALWQEMFRDEPAQLVASAVKAHIATDQKGFPPHIGAIKEAIVKLTMPKEMHMSELEAWTLVRRAIDGAAMTEWSRKCRNGVIDPRTSAEVNFDKLPEFLQRLVGHPKQLAEWNNLPTNVLDTVIQSNFMRSFRVRIANEREFMALPSDVRQTMERLAGGMKMEALTEGETK